LQAIFGAFYPSESGDRVVGGWDRRQAHCVAAMVNNVVAVVYRNVWKAAAELLHSTALPETITHSDRLQSLFLGFLWVHFILGLFSLNSFFHRVFLHYYDCILRADQTRPEISNYYFQKLRHLFRVNRYQISLHLSTSEDIILRSSLRLPNITQHTISSKLYPLRQ
jgi:hypothetical protein